MGASLYIVAMSVAMRFLLPWAAGAADARWGFDLVPYYPLLTSYFVVGLVAVLGGLVGGFLLLESREDGTVRAVRVSPLRPVQQVAVSGTALTVATALLTLVEAPLVGLALPRWATLLGVAVASAPAAVVLALAVATFATNKVEAFAQMKLLSTLGLLPVLAWFLPTPLQLVAGLVFPPALACKAWWVALDGSGSPGPWLLAALVANLAWTAWLLRRYDRVAR